MRYGIGVSTLQWRSVGLQPGKIEEQASSAPATQEASQDLGKSISTP